MSRKQYVITAILHSRDDIERATEQLLSSNFAFHDVAIQEDPEVIKKVVGNSYVRPEKIQDMDAKVPHKYPLLHEDMGWLLGAVVAVPVLFTSLIGMYFFAEKDSAIQNYVVLACCIIVGLVPGTLSAWWVNKSILKKEQKQLEKGGKVLHVNAYSYPQLVKAKKILKQYNASRIRTGTMKK